MRCRSFVLQHVKEILENSLSVLFLLYQFCSLLSEVLASCALRLHENPHITLRQRMVLSLVHSPLLSLRFTCSYHSSDFLCVFSSFFFFSIRLF